MLGIIIGIASVITMIALGQGSKQSIQDEIKGMGSNIIMIFPGGERRAGVRLDPSEMQTLKLENYEALRDESIFLSAVSPYVTSSGQLVSGNNNYPSTVTGAGIDYLQIRQLNIEDGEMFTEQDIQASAKVCVIGKTIGQGDVKKVRKQSVTILVMGLILGVAIGLFTFFIRGPFLSLYSLTPEATGYAMQFMAVYAVIWPFSLLEMVGMIAILRAGGDGKTGFYTDIVSMWCTTIPLAAAGAFILNWHPVVVVTIIKMTIVIEAIVGIIRVLSMKWVHDLTRHEA